MQALIRVAALLAAAAAGLALVKRRNSRQDEDDPHVVLLRDEDAVISAADVSNAPEEPARHHTVPARVRTCYRRMDPLTFISYWLVWLSLAATDSRWRTHWRSQSAVMWMSISIKRNTKIA